MNKSKNKLLKQFTTLLLGSFSSFGINFLSLFLFARFYSKESFGVYALFLSIASIGSVITTLRLENLIVLEDTKREAYELARINITIVSLFFTLILLVSCFLFVLKKTFFLYHPINWIFVSICLFNLALISVLLSWNNKIKKYKVISVYKLIQAIVLLVFGVLLGNLNYKNGLNIAFTLATFVGAVYLLLLFFKEEKSLNKPTFSNIKKTLLVNKEFIKTTFGLDFFNQIVRFVPNFVLQFFFGSDIVGVYDMSTKIVNIPKNIFSANLGELFYQKGSVFYKKKPKKWRELSSNVLKWLLILAITSYLPLIFFGKELFEFFLGEKWILSGELSQIMAVWYTIYFITSPLAYVFYINKKLNILLQYIIFSFFIKVLALYFLSINFSEVTATKYFLITSFLLEFGLLLLLLKHLKIKKIC